MKNPFSEIIRLYAFERDIKKLLKRFKTIEDDLRILLENAIFIFHKKSIDIKGIFQIPDLCFENPKIFKVKKFACRFLKGKGNRTGLRLIYAFFEEKDKIELIEIYYKGDKENEDRERIFRFYKV